MGNPESRLGVLALAYEHRAISRTCKSLQGGAFSYSGQAEVRGAPMRAPVSLNLPLGKARIASAQFCPLDRVTCGPCLREIKEMIGE